MEVVVAAISAAIALVALVISVAVARRQTAIQERVAAIEEARRAEEVEARGRARVTASFLRGARNLKFVLHNEGPALARKVEADIASLDDRRAPQVHGLDALPIDLQPGQEMALTASAGMGVTARVRVTLRWTDEAGGHEEPFTLQT